MTNDNNQQPEPTVLDLYKSVTKDWTSFFNFIRSLWDARKREEVNRAAVEQARHVYEEVQPPALPASAYFPWRAFLGLSLALIGQFLLEPPGQNVTVALAFYIMAVCFVIWGYLRGEWHLPVMAFEHDRTDPFTISSVPLFGSVAFAVAAFVEFGGNRFNGVNLTLWSISIGLVLLALYLRNDAPVQKPTFNSRSLLWIGLVLGILGISIFFRMHKLDAIPAEPFSDQAEKILDVYDITQGQTKIFFERNTGREAIQMYWTLVISRIFGTGLSFFSLKLGTALLGLFTLPFIYMLGREFGNPRAGLIALFLFGVAYWPNVISRIGLRFPLYPLFAAPTLLFFIRGLRTRNRNDFILSGIFLGLGLHGYSPFRIVPIILLATLAIYWLHTRSKEARTQSIWWLLVVGFISLIIFLPLLRYWVDEPSMFGFRAFTRLSSIEQPLPAPAYQIFLSNLTKGLLMFNWDDGEIWVNSMPHRPALDFITGALFVIGVVLVLVRYLRGRDWRDLVLLAWIPLLIMPSVLSLAFPGENPALNRAGGGAIVAILISALALDGFLTSFEGEKRRQYFAWGFVLVLLGLSAFRNYDIVFNQFDQNFRAGAWNTSEMGKLISEFRDTYGETDTVWVVPFPYWVDTRLPGVWAGIPNRDFAMWQDQLPTSVDIPGPKMFIFWHEDTATQEILTKLYPQGKLSRYTSATPGKDFMVFFVEK
jgi:hypothetical protein